MKSRFFSVAAGIALGLGAMGSASALTLADWRADTDGVDVLTPYGVFAVTHARDVAGMPGLAEVSFTWDNGSNAIVASFTGQPFVVGASNYTVPFGSGNLMFDVISKGSGRLTGVAVDSDVNLPPGSSTALSANIFSLPSVPFGNPDFLVLTNASTSLDGATGGLGLTPSPRSGLRFFSSWTASSGATVNNFQLSVSAVPEPSAYALALSGIGLLAFMARRRKNQAA